MTGNRREGGAPGRNLPGIAMKAAAILVFLEVFFRIGIPATNPPYLVLDGANNILKFDPSRSRDGLCTSGSLAEIRCRWHINNAGWLDDQDYAAGKLPIIAVIGDSFVEAMEVEMNRNLVGVLRGKLGGRFDVFRFGMSGANLSQYLHVSRYIRREFRPKAMVFCLIEDDIRGSLMSAGNMKGNLYFSITNNGIREEFVPYAPSLFRSLYRKSAILRYAWINKGMLSRDAGVSASGGEPPAVSKMVVEYAFARLKKENPGCVMLMVLDAPRKEIYAGIPLENGQNENIIIQACRKFGFRVVDLGPVMASLYARDRRMFNSIGNYHWNEYGHQVVADEVFRELARAGLVPAVPGRAR